MKRYRCIDCGAEGDVVSGMTGCPECASVAIPADPATDQDWTLTRWQWRLLLTASLLWAARHEDQSPYMRVFVGRIWKQILGETAAEQLHAVVYVSAGIRKTSESAEQLVARFSPHELRCLTIWGSWYVESCEEVDALVPDCDFEPILAALRLQRADLSLTFRDEIDDLRAAGYQVEVHEGPTYQGEDGG